MREESVRCPRCGSRNQPRDVKCAHCGSMMPEALERPDERGPDKEKSPVVKYMVIAVVVGLIFMLGNVHVLVGKDVGMRLVERDSPGFRELVIPVDSINRMPIERARVTYPIGSQVLEREGLRETQHDRLVQLQEQLVELEEQKRKRAEAVGAPFQGQAELNTQASPSTDNHLSGKLSRVQVIEGMNTIKEHVQRCGDSGVVKIKLVISEQGTVTSAEAVGPNAGTPTGTCAANAVRTRAVFPSSKSTTTVVYPFRL